MELNFQGVVDLLPTLGLGFVTVFGVIAAIGAFIYAMVKFIK